MAAKRNYGRKLLNIYIFNISLNLRNFNQHRLTSTINGLNHLNSNNLTIFQEFSLVITYTHYSFNTFTVHTFSSFSTFLESNKNKKVERLLRFFSENILKGVTGYVR